MATVDPIALIQDIAKSGGDIWEACVSAGIQAKALLNEGRWAIGDLACLIATRYNENAIRNYAHSIKYGVRSVYEYRQVAGYWEMCARAQYLQECPNLDYSHYREAMRLKSLKAAKAFLYECADQDWTYDKARIELNKRLGKPLPPLQLLNAAEVCIVGIDQSFMRLDVVNIDLECNDALMAAWRSGKPVKVVITEVEAKTS